MLIPKLYALFAVIASPNYHILQFISERDKFNTCNPCKSIYTVIMKYREKIKNIDLLKLAQVLGASVSTASRIRSGRRKPDLNEAQALINGIRGLTPKDFF